MLIRVPEHFYKRTLYYYMFNDEFVDRIRFTDPAQSSLVFNWWLCRLTDTKHVVKF
jgi:hypothetical protein